MPCRRLVVELATRAANFNAAVANRVARDMTSSEQNWPASRLANLAYVYKLRVVSSCGGGARRFPPNQRPLGRRSSVPVCHQPQSPRGTCSCSW